MPEMGDKQQKTNIFTIAFESYRNQLDAKHEKRERLVRASRDVTQLSKKLIFELHRSTRDSIEQSVIKANESASKIRETIATRIASELDNDQYNIYHRAFSPGLQEYIEAVLFLGYLEHGRLLSLEELDIGLVEACVAHDIKYQMPLSPTDILLGVADFTGELMRLSIDSIASGDRETPFKTLAFMQGLCTWMRNFNGPLPKRMHREWARKLKVMQQSLRKVEKSCYGLSVRAAEVIGKRERECYLDTEDTEDTDDAEDMEEDFKRVRIQ